MCEPVIAARLDANDDRAHWHRARGSLAIAMIPNLFFGRAMQLRRCAVQREITAPALLRQFNLFEVQSQASDRQEYLLRPDLGRKLSEAAQDPYKSGV